MNNKISVSNKLKSLSEIINIEMNVIKKIFIDFDDINEILKKISEISNQKINDKDLISIIKNIKDLTYIKSDKIIKHLSDDTLTENVRVAYNFNPLDFSIVKIFYDNRKEFENFKPSTVIKNDYEKAIITDFFESKNELLKKIGLVDLSLVENIIIDNTLKNVNTKTKKIDDILINNYKNKIKEIFESYKDEKIKIVKNNFFNLDNSHIGIDLIVLIKDLKERIKKENNSLYLTLQSNLKNNNRLSNRNSKS